MCARRQLEAGICQRKTRMRLQWLNQWGKKILNGSLGGKEEKTSREAVCVEAAKMSSLRASLSWQLWGAPPKVGSGKHKGSL